MPAPIIYQKDAALNQGIMKLGSSLSSAISDFAKLQQDKQKKQQESTILNQTLGNLSLDSTPIEIMSAINKLQGKVDPTILGNIVKQYEPIIKESLKRQTQQDLFKSLGIDQPLLTPDSQINPPSSQVQPTPPLDQSQNLQPASNLQLPQQSKIQQFSDQQIQGMIASGNPALVNLAKYEQERRNQEQKADIAQRKEFREERAYHTSQTKPLADEIQKLRSSVPKRQLAADMAIDAIRSKNVGALSLANLSERLGMPELQTARGAQLNSAIKEGLVSNVGRVSARAQNMFMEKQLLSALPRVGQSEEANLTAAEIFNAELELDKAKINEYDKLVKEDIQKYSYVRSDINERLSKNLIPIEDNILKKTAFKTRQFAEQEDGVDTLKRNAMKKVPKGTYLTPQNMLIMAERFNGDLKKVLENAKKLGYSIPSKKELSEWL